MAGNNQNRLGYRTNKLYIVRVADQGNLDEFCPRCERYGRRTALQMDQRGKQYFKYCMGCGWEPAWEDNGLPLVV